MEAITSWIADAFARENEALTKALQISLSDDSYASETLSYIPPPPHPAAESESVARRSGIGRTGNTIPCTPSAKISKRKLRASNRSATTYINADPADFRRMVQELTGIQFGGVAIPVEKRGRQEPKRSGMGRVGQVQGYLPTLDTSALMLDRVGIGPGAGGFGLVEPNDMVFEFEPFPSFPT